MKLVAVSEDMLRVIALALMMLSVIERGGVQWVFLNAVSKAIQTGKAVQSVGWVKALAGVSKGKGNCGSCRKIADAKAKTDSHRTPAADASSLALDFYSEPAMRVKAPACQIQVGSRVTVCFDSAEKARPLIPPPRSVA